MVVLRSADRVFCSGADLSEATEGAMEQGTRALVDLQRLIVTHPKPVVVRLAGPVRAGGLGLVASADIAICSDDVTFAFTEVRIGAGSVWFEIDLAFALEHIIDLVMRDRVLTDCRADIERAAAELHAAWLRHMVADPPRGAHANAPVRWRLALDRIELVDDYHRRRSSEQQTDERAHGWVVRIWRSRVDSDSCAPPFCPG